MTPAGDLRISVVGVTGAGKTTFCRRLSQKLGLPHLEMDALHWHTNWRPAAMSDLIPQVERFTAGSGWIVDGNYAKLRAVIWPKATDVVLLWPPYATSLARLLLRTTTRILRRKVLWAGNRETIGVTFSRGSIVLWYLKTFRRRGREYLALSRRPENRHLRFHVVRSNRDANDLVDSFLNGPADRSR